MDLLARLPQDRTLVMGILNVTPDSFSDGGRHATMSAAIEHGLALMSQGADIVDVGGESTRPGATPVPPDQEQERILPVIRELLAAGACVSVDTMHAATAAAALELGEVIVNDVSGLHVEADMPAVVADSGAPYVLMHNRGTPTTMDDLTGYDNVVADVLAELRQVRERLYQAGVRPEQLITDPGLGFAKAGEQNWAVLRGIDGLHALGHPVLVAASRKRFLGTLLAAPEATSDASPAARPGAIDAPARPRPAEGLDAATSAITALSAERGAWAVRVHDVAASADAVRTVAAWHGSPAQIRERRGAQQAGTA